MKKRLVDPFTVFDAKGRSLLSYEHLEQKNALLTSQVARLMRMLRKQMERDGPPLNVQKPIYH